MVQVKADWLGYLYNFAQWKLKLRICIKLFQYYKQQE